MTAVTFWTSAVLVAALDVVLMSGLVWRIPRARFRGLKWPLAATAALLWGAFGAVLMWRFWDVYYAYFYPGWVRWLAPVYSLFYAGLALLFWWLALKLPGPPALSFPLLGGLESLWEHGWGIYVVGLLDKVPMLQGESPIAVLAFAVPEYVLYWGLVLCVAALVGWGWERWRHSPRAGHT